MKVTVQLPNVARPTVGQPLTFSGHPGTVTEVVDHPALPGHAQVTVDVDAPAALLGVPDDGEHWSLDA